MDPHVEKYLARVKGLKAEGTYKRRLSDLRDFNTWIEGRGFDDATALDVLDLEDYFIHQNSRGYAPSTIGSRYQSVQGLYDFLTGKMDLYEDTPFDDLKRSDYVNGNNSRKFDESDIVYVTPEEKELIAENVENPTLRNELLIRLLWQTGIRRGEAARIELDDIDRDDRSIHVYSPKTDESRRVFYQPSLDLLMDQWIDGGYRSSIPKGARTPRLFISPEAGLTGDRVNQIVKIAAANAEIQEVLYIDAADNERCRITAHAFRHGHGVHALKSGIDVRTVQKHLGHAKLEMTMKYLQLIDSDVREGYRRFSVEQAEG